MLASLNQVMPVQFRMVGTYLSVAPNKNAGSTAIISSLILILTAMLIWWGPGELTTWTAASQSLVFESLQWWRLWTATLAHANIAHLLSNSLLFFILGYFLSGYFGRLLFPSLAFVLGGLINALAVMTYPPQVQLLGASGIVYWMGGVWLTLYLLIERRRSIGSRLLRVSGVAILLFLPAEAFDPVVSYRTHFIGFIVGILTALIYFKIYFAQIRAAETFEIVLDDAPNQNLTDD